MYEHLSEKQEKNHGLTLREREFMREYGALLQTMGKDAVIRRENKTKPRKKKLPLTMKKTVDTIIKISIMSIKYGQRVGRIKRMDENMAPTPYETWKQLRLTGKIIPRDTIIWMQSLRSAIG